MANLTDGQTVLLYNNGRYLYIYEKASDNKVWMGVTGYSPALASEDAMPYVWTVSKTDDGNYIFKGNSGKFMPTIAASTQPTLDTTAGEFVITSDGSLDQTKSTSEGGVFFIRNNADAAMYFNGNASGLSFVGWSAVGGNSGYKIEPVTVEENVALFTITYNCIDEDGNSIKTQTAKAISGTAYTLAIPDIAGYSFVSSDAANNSWTVDANKTVSVTYKKLIDMVTDLTTLSNSEAYVIQNDKDSRGTMYSNSTFNFALSSKGQNNNVATTVDYTSDAFLWSVYKSTSGKYYLYNLSTKKFVDATGGANTVPVVKAAVPVTIVASPAENAWIIASANEKQIAFSNGIQYGMIAHWNSTTDPGNQQTLYKSLVRTVSDEELATIAARVDMAEKYSTQMAEAKTIISNFNVVGLGYNADSDAAKNLVSVYADGECLDGQALTVAITAIKTQNIVTFAYDKKYALKNVANPTLYLEYTTTTQGTIDTPHLTNTGKTSSTYDASSNNYSFSFYRQGDNVYMYNVGSKTFVSTYGSDAWSLSTTPTAMTVSPITSANYAFKFVSGGEYTHMHINNGSNYATGTVTWTSGSNASQWNLIEVGDVDAADLATITSYAEYGTNMATAASLVSTENCVGGYTTAQLAELKAVYNGGSCTIDNSELLIKAISEVKAIGDARIKLNYNKKYAIRSKRINTDSKYYYLEYSEAQGIETPHLTTTVKTGNDYSSTDNKYTFSLYQAEDGKLYMYNVGNKNFLSSSTSWTLSSTAVPVSVVLIVAEAETTPAYYSFKIASEGTGSYINLQNGTTTGLGTWSADEGSQWSLVEIEDVDATTLGDIKELVANATTTYSVTITDAGYATFSATDATLIPEGVTAMRATSSTSTSIRLENIEDGIVPASYGVVIKGNAGTYTFKKTLKTGDASVTNILKNTASGEANAVSGDYVLSNKDAGKVGFYKAASTLVIPANKAFFNETTNNSKGFIFDEDGLTGIDGTTIQGDSTAKTYYNLNGTKESNPKKGNIYVVDGKTIILK